MYSLYDTVRLKKDDVAHGVKAHYLGAVVDVLSDGEAYTIEFIDDAGETVEAALLTEYAPEELTLVEPYES